jgi:hypothetical protein
MCCWVAASVEEVQLSDHFEDWSAFRFTREQNELSYVLLENLACQGHVGLQASPDLAVEEDGEPDGPTKASKQGDNPDVIPISLQAIYQAAAPRLRVEPQDIVHFDIAKAARIRGSHGDADLATTIDNGCDALAQMC